MWLSARWRLMVALAFVVALGAAPGGGVVRAQPAAPPLKIGLMADQSGPYADNGGPGSVAAARMAIEDFGGTVLGRKIELVVADDQNKPDIGTAIARKWLDVDGVETIVTGSASSVAFGLQEQANRHGKPFLIAGTGSSDFTGKSCSPLTIQFIYDTYSMPNATVGSMLEDGKDTWFFIHVDYAFGAALVRESTHFIEAAHGTVLGVVRHPLGTTDFGAILLQAQASPAKAIGLASAGDDLVNLLKQAREFGTTKSGKVIVGIAPSFIVIHAAGAEAAQGLLLSTPFYWDLNDATRAWTKRYRQAFRDRAPDFIQAGTYSAVLHYLKGVQAAGTTDGPTVVAKMKALPVNDFEMTDVHIREDGTAMRPMYLMQVKTPAESTGPDDLYRLVRTVPAERAWRPMSEGGCGFISKK